MYILIQREYKAYRVLIEAVLPTLPMMYVPFNVYLDSKSVSILIEAVLPTLPMLYLPINVYLESKRVGILIEAVLPTSWWCPEDDQSLLIETSSCTPSSFSELITTQLRFHMVLPQLVLLITNVVPSLQCISWIKESKHTHRSSYLPTLPMLYLPIQCISWIKESKHTHRSSFANITNVVPSHSMYILNQRE